MTGTKKTGEKADTRSRVDANAISENLRLYRVKRRMTQTDLAIVSGIARNMITYIERGQRSPNLSTLSRIAEGLGIPTALLLMPLDFDSERERLIRMAGSL